MLTKHIYSISELLGDDAPNRDAIQIKILQHKDKIQILMAKQSVISKKLEEIANEIATKQEAL